MSLLTYSRSASAGPLRELIAVLRQVRSGIFMPDESKSGSLLHEEKGPAGFLFVAPEPALEPSAEEVVPVEKADEDAISDSGESSSARSTSDESEGAGAEAEAVAESIAPRSEATEAFERLHGKRLYRHEVFSTVHFQASEATVGFLCGRVLHAGYIRIQSRPGGIPLCQDCFSGAVRLHELLDPV